MPHPITLIASHAFRHRMMNTAYVMKQKQKTIETKQEQKRTDMKKKKMKKKKMIDNGW